ncbi:MAG: hypothetical protein E7667_03540 [Ruminococcaceae bacterium]|nr:hypothetical protein [Oscillospiraceae bacterium]
MRCYGNCDYELPRGVVKIVESLCGDYYRRSQAIKNGSAKGAVLDEYLRLNIAVETALENVETGIRAELLRDIAIGRGYNRSTISAFMAKNTYYQRRHKLIYDISAELNLA